MHKIEEAKKETPIPKTIPKYIPGVCSTIILPFTEFFCIDPYFDNKSELTKKPDVFALMLITLADRKIIFLGVDDCTYTFYLHPFVTPVFSTKSTWVFFGTS